MLLLQKADFLLLFLLEVGLSNNLVIFNIEINKTTILLKL